MLILSSLVPRAWQWQCIPATSPLSVLIASFSRRWSAAWTRFDRSRISSINVMYYSAGPAKIMLWEGDSIFVSVQQVSDWLTFLLVKLFQADVVTFPLSHLQPHLFCMLYFKSNLRSALKSPTLPHYSLVWPQLRQFAHRWFVLCEWVWHLYRHCQAFDFHCSRFKRVGRTYGCRTLLNHQREEIKVTNSFCKRRNVQHARHPSAFSPFYWKRKTTLQNPLVD